MGPFKFYAMIIICLLFNYALRLVFNYLFCFVFCSDLVFIWSKLHHRLKTLKTDLLEEIHQLMLSATNVNSIFPFIRAILQEVSRKFELWFIFCSSEFVKITGFLDLLNIQQVLSLYFTRWVKTESSSVWSFVLMP